MNGMGPTIALIDYQERMKQRIADDERLMEFATAVIYGEDGTGGVSALMGSAHADALFWRFLAAGTWRTCTEQCDASESTVRRMVREAFDLVDALGFDRTAKGEGIAED
ncbi:hypothetical protein [Eggerthella guodeyinii]|uniref:Uncharacterized protein n=1 Tax=Eggerthella guodeyinii TaxID=2690837 RepID=A0A6N7RM69_9ACTN|nr:hypothetical protein [Eggerthella guodeyinii]MRX82244.1 hypothetical protein [Eggerthella guodeyinii]